MYVHIYMLLNKFLFLFFDKEYNLSKFESELQKQKKINSQQNMNLWKEQRTKISLTKIRFKQIFYKINIILKINKQR